MKIFLSIARLVAVLALAAPTGGCFLGVLGDKLTHSDTVDAQYQPKPEPLLIVVDRRAEAGISEDTADRVALLLEQDLAGNNVGPLVPQSKVIDLRTMRPADYHAMSAVEKGRALGATQVLRVELYGLRNSAVMGAGESTSRIESRVCILDAQNGQYRWPVNGEGKNVAFATKVTSPDLPYEGLAARIGALFHESKK